jgi:hypothetical protein
VVLWAVAAIGAVIALVALASTRRLARKLDTLNQSYWELRYDYTRLRAHVARLDPEQGQDSESVAASSPASSVTFVPLSAIRKKDQ